MKIKSRGGHVQNTEFYYVGQIMKRASERQDVLGPFKVGGKRFVVVAYFEKWSYWSWLFRTGIIYLLSFFYPDYYYKTNSLAARVKGMLILDNDANPVFDKKLQLRVAKVALPWIDVYLCPVFPPRMLTLVNMTAKLHQKAYEQCKNRQIPKPTTFAEGLFFEKLREADQQVMNFHSVFLKLHSSMKNATNLFRQVSDKPSEVNIARLKSVTGRVASSFERLAVWCDERAKSWADFVDSHEFYKISEKRKESLLKRYGSSGLWKALLAIVAYLISAGNFAFSATFSLISSLGVEGFKALLSFRWQTKMLKRAAKRHGQISNRAQQFLRLYDLPSQKGFLR